MQKKIFRSSKDFLYKCTHPQLNQQVKYKQQKKKLTKKNIISCTFHLKLNPLRLIPKTTQRKLMTESTVLF